MKVEIEMSEEEIRRVRQLNSKAFVVGTSQRAAVVVLERALAGMEERVFQAAVDAYCDAVVHGRKT